MSQFVDCGLRGQTGERKGPWNYQAVSYSVLGYLTNLNFLCYIASNQRKMRMMTWKGSGRKACNTNNIWLGGTEENYKNRMF
jgi:hypothetical protein